MESSPVPAEKYQLKWHSHVDNLNNSVSNLFRNERFADVMLISSDSGQGIPAHRLVLSSSSHFFSSLFDSNSTPANSLIYVVMPSELTRRSIDILVQYMYIGEATVPKDVLNEVLRGGEILKIRGLCRNSSIPGDPSFNEPADQSFPASCPQQQRHPEIPGVSSRGEREKLINRGHEVLKESPVVVLNTKPPRKSVESGRKTPKQEPISSRLNLCVKKDMAIDPSCQSCIVSTRNYMPHSPPEQIRTPLSENQNHANRLPTTPGSCAFRPSKFGGRFVANSGPSLDDRDGENSDRQVNKPNKPMSPIASFSGANLERHSAERRDFKVMSIKQEPAEWHPQTTQHHHGGVLIKPEVVFNEDSSLSQDQETADEQGQNYSPLTCELCKETFAVPGDWVRHIESHAETPQTVPKKRRRTEEVVPLDGSMAALRCDLCCMYFETPAQWVRHIQNSHTESELAQSNSRGSQYPASLMQSHQPEEKAFCCHICDRGFSAKPNLVRHLRTMHYFGGGGMGANSDDENQAGNASE